MVKFLYLCFFVVGISFLSSCTSFSQASLHKNKIDEISDDVTANFAKKMRGKGLSVAGSGGGEKDGKIWLMEITFDIRKKLAIDLARQLIVETVNQYLEDINNSKKLRNSLSHHPFTTQDIRVGIIGEKIINLDNLQPWMVSMSHGEVRYLAANPDGGRLIELYRESFEEAEQKVKQAQENQE